MLPINNEYRNKQLHTHTSRWLVIGWVTTNEYHPSLRFHRQTSTYGASTSVYVYTHRPTAPNHGSCSLYQWWTKIKLHPSCGSRRTSKNTDLKGVHIQSRYLNERIGLHINNKHYITNIIKSMLTVARLTKSRCSWSMRCRVCSTACNYSIHLRVTSLWYDFTTLCRVVYNVMQVLAYRFTSRRQIMNMNQSINQWVKDAAHF